MRVGCVVDGCRSLLPRLTYDGVLEDACTVREFSVCLSWVAMRALAACAMLVANHVLRQHLPALENHKLRVIHAAASRPRQSPHRVKRTLAVSAFGRSSRLCDPKPRASAPSCARAVVWGERVHLSVRAPVRACVACARALVCVCVCWGTSHTCLIATCVSCTSPRQVRITKIVRSPFVSAVV